MKKTTRKQVTKVPKATRGGRVLVPKKTWDDMWERLNAQWKLEGKKA